MHIISPETDNYHSWICGRKRMTVENISWSNLHKRMLRTCGGERVKPTTSWSPPDHKSDFFYWTALPESAEGREWPKNIFLDLNLLKRMLPDPAGIVSMILITRPTHIRLSKWGWWDEIGILRKCWWEIINLFVRYNLKSWKRKMMEKQELSEDNAARQKGLIR